MRIGLVFEIRTNEDVSRIERATWYKWTREEFRTGQTIGHVVVVFFFSLYMYLSYIFYFKESTIITTEKQKEKNKYKKTYRHEEDKSLPILFDYVLPETKFSFFFQLVLNLHPYLLVPFTIKGRESPRSPPYLFSFFFSFPSFREE